jgi:hypothetical protein
VKKRLLIFLIIILLLPSFVGAIDYGLLLNQFGNIGNDDDDGFFSEYNASFIPHFSFLFGKTGSFFTSAVMTVGYKDGFYYYPELLRTEVALRFGSLGIKAGRINYSDPLTYIAEGLFDGIQLSYSSWAGHLSFGAWYTGFQYKKSANIFMTEKDQELYNSPLNYNDFFNTYFAPMRLLAAVGWDHPSVGGFLRLNTSVIAQMDMTEGFKDYDGKLNTGYFVLKMGIPIKRFLFEIGGSLEASQFISVIEEKNEEGKITEKTIEKSLFENPFSFTAQAGLHFMIPMKFNNRLSLTGIYSSGVIEDRFSAFTPVTSKNLGKIFQVKMTSLTVMSLNYAVRFTDSFGINFNSSYYMRNDLVTFNTYPFTSESKDNYRLGTELYGTVIASIFSDLQFRVGGGVFLPSLGNVWSDGKVLWRVDFTAILGIF